MESYDWYAFRECVTVMSFMTNTRAMSVVVRFMTVMSNDHNVYK